MTRPVGPNRISAQEIVAQAWNAEGLTYVIAHGLEGYPNRLGRDLDLLMDQRQAHLALHRASDLLRSLGWTITACPPSLWGQRLVVLKEEDGHFSYIELHTMGELQWALMRFADTREPTSIHLGPFPLSYWATFAKAVLLPLLAGDVNRFSPAYLSELKRLGLTAEAIVERGERYFGHRLTSLLVSSALAGDVDRLISLRGAARRACLRWILTHPIPTVRAMPRAVWRKLYRPWAPCGVQVILDIPVGLRADRLVEALSDTLEEVFVTIRIHPQSVRHRAFALAQQAVLIRIKESASTPTLVAVRSWAHWLPIKHSTTDFSCTRGSEEEVGRDIGRWIIHDWASRIGCDRPP